VENEFDDTNEGTLSPVKEKTEDWHADFNGSINIEGKWFWLNGYKRKNKGTGEGFLKVKIGAPKKPKVDVESDKPKPKTLDDFDDISY
jgi:hypothetical protein